jgi:phosphoribosylformylglycinamidine cyclo-ligase
MGNDYAIFIDQKDSQRVIKIIKNQGFSAKIAGYIESGQKQVIIKPKNIVYNAKTLDLR